MDKRLKCRDDVLIRTSFFTLTLFFVSVATEDKSNDAEDDVVEVVDSDSVVEVSSDEERLTGTNSNLKAQTKVSRIVFSREYLKIILV